MTIVGPGYGSNMAQRYALRYPQHVRRLILTAVTDAAGMDPLFRDTPAAARRVLTELCRGKLCNRFTRDPVADTRGSCPGSSPPRCAARSWTASAGRASPS